MKKWTVMLIPHDRGGTRTLSLASYHVYAFFAVLVTLSFATMFLFSRHDALMAERGNLRDVARTMELRLAELQAARQEIADDDEATPADLRAVEARLRAEYEQSLDQINRQLSKLYELEQRARSFAGLAEEQPVLSEPPNLGEGGRGGVSSVYGPSAVAGSMPRPSLPSMTFGMSRPSADLILQEAQLRTEGFTGAIAILARHQDALDRVPSIWPVSRRFARLSSNFGYRKDPFTRRVRHHSGTDLAAKTGTPVMAAAKGRVVESEYHRDYGHKVVIDHGNGIETLYAHLSKRLVSVGDQVERSDTIGRVGSTGRSTGPHLHYEVHKNGSPVNPRSYMD